MVKSPPFHGGVMGSNPVGVTNKNSVYNSVGQSAWSYIQVVGGSNPSARALQGCKSNTNAIVNRL